MALNTEKYINVYYNKGDRKPYDVNGKPIAYLGADYVGANEATIIRFNIGDDTGVVEGVADVKRPDGEKAFLIMSKVTIGTDVFYELPLTDWHTAKVGKLVIGFKAFDGAITVVDGVIQANNLRVIVSDIFNVDIGYSPNSTEEAPPFDPNDLSAIIAALGNKLDKVNGINVVQALPTPADNSLNGRWYLVKSGSPESVGKLFVFNNATAVEVELGTSQFNFSTTGLPTDALTAGQMRYNDTTGSLDLGLKGDHVLKMGEVLVKRVRNDDATSLKVGQLVYVFGSVGNSGLLKVKKASNVGESTSSKTFGMVATAMNTTSSKDGYVYLYGLLQGVDLTDADVGESAFVAGDVGASLWLGENGKITKTLPTADNKHSVFVGYLDSFAGNGSNCGIYTKIQNGYEIGELHDVRISAVADNHILRYNSTRGVWENTAELTTAETDIANIEDGTTIVGKANADKDGNEFDATYLKKASASSTYVPLSSKGVANGVAPLDSNNKIPSIHLPGGVDDIKEFANLASFPATGEASIIYVALDTNIIYRWSGSAYVEISSSLALGTTSSTAFPGDRGLATETQSNTLNTAVNIAGQVNTQIPYWNSTNSRFESDPQLTFNPALNRLVAYQALIQNNLYTETISTANGSPSANIALSTTGTTISRNINDTNAPLKVNKVQGTGNILQLQSAGANKLEVDVNGWFYQNETRLFTQPGGTTNTFFGLTSGGSATTGGNNTAFGNDAFRDLTSGGNNVAVGKFAGVFQTTQSNNVLIGSNSGRTTAGNNNTFVGTDSGYSGAWGTQASASNSTGIGYQSFTDKSNQMVFGNASVTEYLFGRKVDGVKIGIGTNTANLNAFGNEITLSGSGFTAEPEAFINLQGTRTTDVNIAGVNFYNAADRIGRITVRRSGANNSGRIQFNTSNAGTESEKMTILPNGNVGIGTASPASLLTITGGDLLINRATSNQANSGTIRIAEENWQGGFINYDGSTNKFFIGTHDTNDTTGANDLQVITLLRNGSSVGINETTPTAQLQVKSGATNRVPLIVDTLASHATNLQEWKINGTVQAFVDNGGYFRGTGIYNKSTFNNSIIYLNNTGTLIQRNIADTNPALIVNLANASATGNIQVWQKAGVAVANITESGQLATPVVKNVLNGSNSLLELSNNGAIISRNRTDSNPALRVNQIHASSTGDLLQLEKEGVDVYAFTHDGTLKAPATFTIDPSTHGNATGKVIILGDLQVDGTTTTINSTTLEVDDKNIELSKGAANKAASDGAGISIDLGTDGEANLTYGATDDIFNLNKGLNIAGQTQISSATFPALSVERTTTATGSVIGVSRFLATTSGDMGDGFGGSISFQIKDNANVDNTLATIVGIRSGADNSGRLSLQTNNAGTQTEKMTILPNGKVGIGTASPSTVLNLVTQSNTDGIQIRRNSNTSGEYGLLSFRIATSESAVNYAEIRAIRTDRAVAQDTDLVLLTRSNSAVTERLRIRDDGNVGIGTSSPAEPLTVRGNVRSQSTAESSTNIITRAFSDGASTRYGVVEAFRDTVGSLPLLLNPSGGNVGIGETNLNETVSKLHIKGNVNINVGYLRWNNGNAQIDGQDTNLKLSTWTGSALTEKMRITGAGNVGIGTASPASKLQVQGTSAEFSVRNDATNALVLGGFADGKHFIKSINLGTAFTPLSLQASSFSFENGNVGIGTTDPSV
jgi:hypothetical protein